jgi:spoIIIJ-associated protein
VVDDADAAVEETAGDTNGTAPEGATSEADESGEAVTDVAEADGAAAGTESGADGTDSAETADAGDEGSGEGGRLRELEHEGEVAADYLEALLDILDMDGDLELDIEGDRASVAIIGDDLDDLIGARGVTLEALQELTRLAVLRETGDRSRLMLDIGGYRAQRRTELVALARAAGERVASNGQDEKLAPMSPFERKVVHDTIAGLDGVLSESEGEEPQRRVVVRPA